MNWERIEQEMLGQPIQALQFMLNRLSRQHEDLPELIPNGRFDEPTLEAVMRFQKLAQIPVTGIVDQNTWHMIREKWLEAERAMAEPRNLRGFPKGKKTGAGESQPYLYLVQAMFQSLGNVLEGIQQETIDGIHNGTSVENTKWLQERAGLEPNGELNRQTWDALSRLYELFVIEPSTMGQNTAVIPTMGRG